VGVECFDHVLKPFMARADNLDMSRRRNLQRPVILVQNADNARGESSES